VAEGLVTKKFEHLDVGQLLKHILGLTRAFGREGFVLLYLWYDVPGSGAATKHQAELTDFSEAVRDEVVFRGETYQNFFRRLGAEVAGTPYEEYLRSRYFAESMENTCSLT
jgi:hypothetical protein